MDKRTTQRIEMNNRNNGIFRMIREELPGIDIENPRQRISTVVEYEFATDLLKYARQQGMSSRSELIEKILVEWWNKESMGDSQC